MQGKQHPVAGARLACVLALALLPALSAHADDAPVTAKLGGRVHLDFGAFDNDDRGPPNRNDTEVRRAWLGVSGRLYDFKYKVEGDFADSRNILARNVYLSRAFGRAGTLTVGQFKQHFSLDDRTSSNYGPLLERGSGASTLAPLFRLGAGWQYANQQMTWAASGYSMESIDVTAAKGYGVATRATWAPPRADDSLLHLGVSLAHERQDQVGGPGRPSLKIRPRPAGHVADNSRMTLIDFSAGRDTDVDKWALEYAQMRGPWSWQAEWLGARLRDGAQQGQVQAAYALLSWFVTGESRRYDYKSGRFTRMGAAGHPAGAFELALRYDTMWGGQHFNGQPDLRRGRIESLTLGGNWYVRPNLRLMLDLIQSHNRDTLAGQTLDRTRAVTGRFQYDF